MRWVIDTFLVMQNWIGNNSYRYLSDRTILPVCSSKRLQVANIYLACFNHPVTRRLMKIGEKYTKYFWQGQPGES